MSDLEKKILEAKETNDFMPVWEQLISTQLYVVVIPNGSGDQTSDFTFSIFQNPETQNLPFVVVSEILERLENRSSEKAIRVIGAKLIQLLNSEVGIMISLEEGAFGIPKEQVQWLRESIQTAH